MTRGLPALLEWRGREGGRELDSSSLLRRPATRRWRRRPPLPSLPLPFFFSSVVVRTKGAIIEETRQPGRRGARQAGGAFLPPPPLFVSPPFRILNSHCTGPRQPSAPRFLYVTYQRPHRRTPSLLVLTLAPATYSSGPSRRPCNRNMPL